MDYDQNPNKMKICHNLSLDIICHNVLWEGIFSSSIWQLHVGGCGEPIKNLDLASFKNISPYNMMMIRGLAMN
jgi:hypothetical protein